MLSWVSTGAAALSVLLGMLCDSFFFMMLVWPLLGIGWQLSIASDGDHPLSWQDFLADTILVCVFGGVILYVMLSVMPLFVVGIMLMVAVFMFAIMMAFALDAPDYLD